MIRRLLPVLMAACAAAAAAQEGDWLASPAAREFRQRVADLAVLYGDARGIDPQGLLIVARRTGAFEGACASVEVVVGPAERPLLRESLRGCKHT